MPNDLWSKLKNSSLQSGDADSDNLFKVQLDDGFSISKIESAAGVDKDIKKSKI